MYKGYRHMGRYWGHTNEWVTYRGVQMYGDVEMYGALQTYGGM